MSNWPDGTRVWHGVFSFGSHSATLRHGELRYHPAEGIELTIFDSNLPIVSDTSSRDYDLIIGKLENHIDVTLINSFDLERRTNFYGSGIRRIIANYAILNISLSHPLEKCFSSMDFTSHALTAWHVPIGVRCSIVREDKSVFQITCKLPDNKSAAIDDNRSFTLWSGASIPSGPSDDGSFNVKISTHVELQYKTPVSWHEMYRDQRCLEDFFCIALGTFVGPPVIRLSINPQSHSRMRGSGQNHDARFKQAEFLTSQTWYRKVNIPSRHNRTIVFTDLQDNFCSIFQTWFEIFPRIVSILSLYRLALEQNAYPETKFSLLAQAVESFHRNFYGGQELSDGVFQELKEEISMILRNYLQKENLQTFLQRVSFMNQKSLQKQIKELCRDIRNDVKQILSSYKHDAMLVSQYRNEIAHGKIEQRRNPNAIHEIDYLGEFLRIVLELSLLKRLGLKCNILQDITIKNRRFSELGRHRNVVFGKTND